MLPDRRGWFVRYEKRINLGFQKLMLSQWSINLHPGRNWQQRFPLGTIIALTGKVGGVFMLDIEKYHKTGT